MTANARSLIVAIPALNEKDNIEAVLNALLREIDEIPKMTIVVADGGSTDGTQQIVRELAEKHDCIHLIDNPAQIQSAAVNLVARQWSGKADVLVRCDAHAHYPSRFLASLIETMERTGADSVVIPMDSHGTHCLQKAVAWVSDTRIGSGGSAHRGGTKSGFVDHGHHAAFRLEGFLKAGGYDESFTHNEDAEFDCRFRAAGAKIFLNADIRIGYYPRGTLVGLWKQYFNYGKGRARTLRRHPATIRLRQAAVPVHLLLMVFSLVLTLVTSAWIFLAWPLLYFSILLVSSILIAYRNKSACGLWAGVAAAVMHTAWASGFFWNLLTIREARWIPGSIVNESNPR